MDMYYFYPYHSSNNKIGFRSDRSLEGSVRDPMNIAQEIAEREKKKKKHEEKATIHQNHG